MVVVKSMTCREAAKKYPGMTIDQLSRMCTRGKGLLQLYGSKERIPQKEFQRAIFAVKVGKRWFIPKVELDRLFVAG